MGMSSRQMFECKHCTMDAEAVNDKLYGVTDMEALEYTVYLEIIMFEHVVF